MQVQVEKDRFVFYSSVRLNNQHKGTASQGDVFKADDLFI